MGGILAKLPYVETVSITTQLPGTVIFEITESQALAWVELESQRWGNRPQLQGAHAGHHGTKRLADPRHRGNTGEPDGRRDAGPRQRGHRSDRHAVRDAPIQLQRRGMAQDVTSIDLTDLSSPAHGIPGRFTVIFGTEESINYQFGKLASAVSQLTSADRGTLDISQAVKASCSPRFNKKRRKKVLWKQKIVDRTWEKI